MLNAGSCCVLNILAPLFGRYAQLYMQHKAWIKEEQARGNTEMGTGAELDKAMEEVQRDYAAV
jgi:hypothetical protein